MRNYRIYQVRDDEKKYLRNYAFRSLEDIRHAFPGRLGLPRKVWKEVYIYATEKQPSLDWLFCLFNRGMEGGGVEPTPEDFTGHSMSVSDIIETPDGELWFCNPFGWERVHWEEATT